MKIIELIEAVVQRGSSVAIQSKVWPRTGAKAGLFSWPAEKMSTGAGYGFSVV